jgi:hypothetical protein
LVVGVRKITNAGSKKVIGKFPSIKMDTIIWWESQIERDYIYLLEVDPDVISYVGQPFKIFYTDLGKSRSYTPDFLVKRTKGEQVVEVKPISLLNQAKNLNLWRHIAVWCLEQQLEFVVVTDAMIRIQPKLNNIKLLYRYARTSLTANIYLLCQHYFTERESIPLSLARLDLEPLGISMAQLYKLIYSGFLVTDLMQPIGCMSLIQLSSLLGDVNTSSKTNEQNTT